MDPPDVSDVASGSDPYRAKTYFEAIGCKSLDSGEKFNCQNKPQYKYCSHVTYRAENTVMFSRNPFGI